MSLNGNTDETNGYNTVIKNGVTTNANYVKSVIPPIGSVIPWLKTLTGTPSLPDGWVECDGSTISDADSPYDGVTIPDLNGDNRFLRGSSTSGSTGGNDTVDLSHTHSLSTTVGFTGTGAQYVLTSTTTGSAGSATQDILPTYYEVVYIMRIK